VDSSSIESIAADMVRAARQSGQPASSTRVIPLMGGTAHFTVVDGSESMLDRAIALADRCEAAWSRFLPTSDVSRLNRAEGAPTQVDPLTTALIAAMLEGVELTAGDFDPLLLPDVLAIGYAASVVADDIVTELGPSARSGGDAAAIAIDGTTVTLPPGLTLDPGGVGKGLAADLACAQLIADGAAGAMVEISGDLVVAGRAPDGVAWRLGVEDPFVDGAHAQIVRLTRGALVTSSQRKRRFTTARGERHHLIDPRTHDSAVTDVQTVSVIAATGAKAETLTKSGFLREPADFLAWLPTVGAAGLIIDSAGVARESPNWGRYA